MLARIPRWVWYWVVFFLLVTTGMEMRSGTNPASRFALLFALVEDGSVRIDPYHEYTVDWARTPDGHYYSNKAPGPSLVGLPLFALADRVITRDAATRAERDALRRDARPRTEHLLSVTLQALPFAFLVALIAGELLAAGASVSAARFFLAASMFGNTAALFMNTYFGHAMAALWALALALALWKRHFVLAGFAFGMAVLCDFGSAMLLPALLVALALLLPRGERRVGLPRFVAGGIAPGIAWSAYHIAAFGNPFTLPTEFQNPRFVDLSGGRPHLWGVIDLYPHPDAAFELLFGLSRGILWSQPWALVAVAGVAALAWKRRSSVESALAIYAIGSLAGLFVMNAAFRAWHAGYTPGPRYLSAIFPALALVTALHFDRLSSRWREALWAGLFVSLALYAVVMSTTLDALSGMGLWGFYADWLFAGNWEPFLVRGSILILGWGWLFSRYAAPSGPPEGTPQEPVREASNPARS